MKDKVIFAVGALCLITFIVLFITVHSLPSTREGIILIISLGLIGGGCCGYLASKFFENPW